MLCEICHENEARVTYTEIINGVRKEQHLCENCAAKQAPFNIMGKLGPETQFGNILSGLLQSFAKGLGAMQEKEAICGRCGMTASEFAKTGKLGCPECYRAFSAILDKNLSTLQGAVENKGKKPMNAVYFEPAGRAGNNGMGNNNTTTDAQEATGSILGSAGTIDDILGKADTKTGTEKKTRRTKAAPSRISEGKAPDKGAGSPAIAALRRKMEKAVEKEDYEEAAVLRDRINELTGGTGADSGTDRPKTGNTRRTGDSQKTGSSRRTGVSQKTGTLKKKAASREKAASQEKASSQDKVTSQEKATSRKKGSSQKKTGK